MLAVLVCGFDACELFELPLFPLPFERLFELFCELFAVACDRDELELFWGFEACSDVELLWVLVLELVCGFDDSELFCDLDVCDEDV